MDVRGGVKNAIEDLGYKQVSVAEKIGMSEQQISDIVNKRRKLDANEMIDLCNAMNITPDKLLMYGIKSQ